jgi:membrane-bound metal-dependent hydrolase YbcI (DUF457 family)
MTRRIPSAFMVLAFAVFTMICIHYLLDDLDVTTATSERAHTGDRVFILLDTLCATICVAGVALFMSLWVASKQSSTSSGLLADRWVG